MQAIISMNPHTKKPKDLLDALDTGKYEKYDKPVKTDVTAMRMLKRKLAK